MKNFVQLIAAAFFATSCLATAPKTGITIELENNPKEALTSSIENILSQTDTFDKKIRETYSVDKDDKLIFTGLIADLNTFTYEEIEPEDETYIIYQYVLKSSLNPKYAPESAAALDFFFDTPNEESEKKFRELNTKYFVSYRVTVSLKSGMIEILEIK